VRVAGVVCIRRGLIGRPVLVRVLAHGAAEGERLCRREGQEGQDEDESSHPGKLAETGRIVHRLNAIRRIYRHRLAYPAPSWRRP